MTVSSFDILKYFARMKKYSQLEISNFKPPEQRADHTWKYSFDIRYQEGDETRFKELLLLHDPERNSLQTESTVLKELSAKRVPVPELHVYDDNSIFDGEIMIIDRVSEWTLQEKIHDYMINQDLKKDILVKLEMILKMLTLLDFDTPPLSDILYKTSTPVSTDLNEIKSYCNEHLDGFQGMDELLAWLSERLEDFSPAEPKLIHGALSLSHLLLNGEVLVMTDWSTARYDDPRREISRATVLNLLETEYDITLYLYEGLVEKMGYDRGSLDILTIYDGLRLITTPTIMLDTQSERTELSGVYHLSDFSGFTSLVQQITDIDVDFTKSDQ